MKHTILGKSRIWVGALSQPRPYHDITQRDPNDVCFYKTKYWALYVGFYESIKDDYSTDFTGGCYSGNEEPKRNHF